MQTPGHEKPGLSAPQPPAPFLCEAPAGWRSPRASTLTPEAFTRALPVSHLTSISSACQGCLERKH